ncbi:MAG TPA: hypothetical protein VIV12_06790 [Streptosporangiaceae bacterium]
MCHPSALASPAGGHGSLDRCNPACANIARTDTHITALTAEITRLHAAIASPLSPGPFRERLSNAGHAGRKAVPARPGQRSAGHGTHLWPGR